MYSIVRKRCGSYSAQWSLPASHGAAIHAVTIGCATPAELQLVFDLIDDLRGRKCRLLCPCNYVTGQSLAELIPCKRGQTAYFRRSGGGRDHAADCIHHCDPGAFGCGAGGTEPVTFDDFIHSWEEVSSSQPQSMEQVGAVDRPQQYNSILRRSRASLAALQILCLEAAGFSVLLGTDPSLRLPLGGKFAADRLRAGLAAHQATDESQTSIADVLLVDPPSLRNLAGQVIAHVRKNCGGARALVGYAIVVVDSIALDHTTGSSLVTYRRGERQFEVSLPCTIAVTNECVVPDSGPYLLTMRVAIASGAATRVWAYARQVVSRSQLTPLDASTERLSAYDVVSWARSRAQRGIHLSVQRPLRVKIGPLGHAYIADLEVTCRFAEDQFIAFVEVHGVGGGAYWSSKLSTQAEMSALGTVILDDRSPNTLAMARLRLWKSLDEWLDKCLSCVVHVGNQQ